jgi:lipopolysaccharide transport system permease protein
MNDEVKTIIYTPESLMANPKKMITEMFNDLKKCRNLAWRLAVRDISAQYRQSFLGFLWALIIPISNAIVWIFLSGSGIITVSETSVPYPIYVFVGTMLWGIFMDAVNAPLQGTNSAKAMLAKINFPREAIIISGFYQTLFNGVIKIILVLIVVFSTGITPGIAGLLIPLGVLSLILVGMTLGILITPFGILYGDVGKAMPLLLQFLMYVTPVVYPFPKSGFASKLFHVNPLTSIVETVRSWIIGQFSDTTYYFLTVNIITIILLLIVWVIYHIAMPILIERMSS